MTRPVGLVLGAHPGLVLGAAVTQGLVLGVGVAAGEAPPLQYRTVSTSIDSGVSPLLDAEASSFHFTRGLKFVADGGAGGRARLCAAGGGERSGNSSNLRRAGAGGAPRAAPRRREREKKIQFIYYKRKKTILGK